MSQRMVHLGPTLDLPFLFEEWLSVQSFLHGIHKTFLKFGACGLVCVCACSATQGLQFRVFCKSSAQSRTIIHTVVHAEQNKRSLYHRIYSIYTLSTSP